MKEFAQKRLMKGFCPKCKTIDKENQVKLQVKNDEILELEKDLDE